MITLSSKLGHKRENMFSKRITLRIVSISAFLAVVFSACGPAVTPAIFVPSKLDFNTVKSAAANAGGMEALIGLQRLMANLISLPRNYGELIDAFSDVFTSI